MNSGFHFPNAKTHLLSGVLTFFFILLSLQVHAIVRYVKPTASGTGDGTSWANASANLQAMINASGSGDEVWVAAGTYKPTSGNDRNISFVMKNGVGIYGGFNSTETQLSQRNWRTNVTTLSGDINQPGSSGDNSYHVINNDNNNLNISAVLDGFTITAGNANGADFASYGGAILNANASPKISNCIFTNNHSEVYGGAILNFNGANGVITNCIFTGNSSTFGRAVANYESGPTYTNCSFVANLNGFSAIQNNGSPAPTYINCISWGNGEEIANNNSSPVVRNSIIQGGYTPCTNCPNGNGNANPLFVNAAGGDFRLQACSPAINVGSNAAVPSGATTDLDGNPRFYNNGTVDIGAYEFQSTPPFVTCYRDSDNDSFGNLAMSQVFCNTCGTGYVPNGADCNDANQAINPFAAEVCDGADNNCNTQTDEGNVCCPSGNVIYVKANATGANNGTSWTNAYTNLQSALNSNCPNITEIWVAAGTYKPTTGNDRNISFVMKNGVAIYGGFNGTEVQLLQRNWRTNVTTLSGEIGAAGNADNTYRVINNNFNSNAPLGSSAILDGFTVEAANANGGFPLNLGGGMWNAYASPTVRNCIFRNNTATSGAAIFNDNSQANVTNCLFIGNSCSVAGAAISNGGGTASAKVINCTFYGNTGGSGTINNEVNATAISNCIIWGNANGVSGGTVTYSIVQGGFSGVGNLSTDPLFVNAAGGDFRLQACSPAINVGSNAAVPGGITTDLDGNPRFFNNGVVDRGAYEFQGTPVARVTCYQDSDNDNFGNPAVSQVFCNACGTGYVANNTDCNDANDAINPLASEVCDGVDNNCNTQTDEGNVCCPSGNILYVKANATGANNGASWADAYTDLQSALNRNCPNITEIWVAAGTYKPTTGSDRNISFVMKNGVAIYGGFNGTETQLLQRNWRTNVTTLSGDIGAAGNADNSYSVVYAGSGVNTTAIIDGFTVTGAAGGTFGAGIYAFNGSPTISHCLLTGNSSTVFGGGLACYNGSPIVTSCTFSNNTSNAGGGMANGFGGMPIVTNCLFINNTATYFAGGGGLFSQNASMTLTNCTFSGNSSESIHCNVAINISNCVIWGNSLNFYNANASISNCIVQGGYAQCINCPNGNGNANPLFVNAAGGDFSLQACSPAVNTGSNAAVPGVVTTDLDGNPRTFGGTVDMGAYEYQTAPTPIVPVCQNQTVLLNDMGMAAFSAALLNNGSTGCGTLVYTVGGQSTLNFTCSDTGSPIPVTLTVTDNRGITATCPATITVLDNTPPTITCPATQTLALGANCTATLPNYTSLASTGDICGVQSVTQSPIAGTTVSGAGNMTITLTVTDLNDNDTECTFTVTKVDQTPPTISCPATQTLVLGAHCTATLPDYTSLATTADNCGVQSVTQSPIAGTSVSGAGNITVTLTVTDLNGNETECTFTVTKVDNTPPTISCPATQTLVLGANCTATLPNYTSLATTGDNCGVQSVTQLPIAGTTVSGAGNMTITLTVTDINGSETECTFTVTKVDNTPPTITCPATQTLVLGANCTATLPNYTSLATTGDNCGVQSVTQSPIAGTTVSGAGNMTVTLTVTDINGSETECTFTVTKVDNTPPTITCPATQTLVLGANCTATLPNYTSLATTGDNCGVQSVTQSPIAGTTVSGAGNMTITLTVTDINGSETECTFTVTKVDNTPPTITCPATQTLVLGANCTATLPNYTSLATTGDNCGVQSVTQSPIAGTTVSGAGNMTITLTVTDINGSETECTFTVTKVDNTPPTITCPATQTLVLGANCTATLPNYTSLAATGDNCGVQSVTQSPIAGTTVSGAGNMTITLTVTDINGSETECTFTVTKVDNTPPTITCPATQTLVLGANCTATLPNYTSLATTGDNCGVQSVTQSPIAGTTVSGAGNMTITLTVTDINGSETECTFTVTKVDNTPPTITCPATQTLVLGANCTATLPNYTSLATTGDNCGVQSVTQSPIAGTTVSGAGNMTITLTVTDINGSETECTFTVTKVDNTPPTITCPATQTLVLGANCTATLPNYTSLATTGDNCGVQSVTQSPIAGTTVSGAGNMTITLTVTDINGSETECTFTVTKVDNTPPALVCKNTTVFIGNTGTYTLQPADVFNATASSDNCSGLLTVTNISPAMVSCAQLNQTIPVIVTVQDASGNTATCTAQITVQEGTALPLGWSSDNIGNANGAAGYKACSFNGSFTVSANGFSTSSSDVLHFTSQQLCGNGEITVRVMAVSGGGWAGVMMRESLSPGAKKVTLKTQLSNMIRREIRTVQNGPANILNFNRPNHVWLRLVRDGSTFTGYTSLNGTTWSFAFSAMVSMAGCIQLGVFSESINANTTTTATFSNISVTGASNSSLTNGLPDTQVAAEQDEQVRVFPNPTTGEVTIDLDIYAGKPGTIQVFNALGALTTQERLIPGNPETLRLRIGDLAGVYLVIIQVEDRRIVRRVVVN